MWLPAMCGVLLGAAAALTVGCDQSVPPHRAETIPLDCDEESGRCCSRDHVEGSNVAVFVRVLGPSSPLWRDESGPPWSLLHVGSYRLRDLIADAPGSPTEWILVPDIDDCAAGTLRALAELTRPHNLFGLQIEHGVIDNGAAADAMGAFASLRSLRLSNVAVDAVTLDRVLRRYRRLEDLELEGELFTDSSLEVVSAAAGQLQALALTDTSISGASAAFIARLARLRSLSVKSSPFAGTGLDRLSRLDRLERLVLNGSSLADDDLDFIARLQRLTTLDLSRTAIAGSALAHLKHVPLEKLRLVGCSRLKLDAIPGASMSWRSLRYVSMQGCELVDDAVFEVFRQSPLLEELDLSFTGVTGNGIGLLAELPHFRTLRLAGCDHLQAEQLGAVRALSSLQILELRDAPLSRAEVEALRDMNPKLFVTR